jgi:aryl-phospho-beta-D-glucosidase BglC (GH1 family)
MKKKPYIILSVMLTVMLLSACVSSAGASSDRFSDVQSSSWYYDTVTQMTEKGWLNGYPDGTFRPNATITGAEYTSVIARIKGLGSSSNTVSNHWASGILQSALDAGYYDYDELPPTGEKYDSIITRQTAVSILMRAFAPDASGDYNTESVKMNDFTALDGRYYNTTFAAYATGMAQGDSNGNFRPKSGLTRAEACTLIMRAFDKFGTDSDSVPNDTETPSPSATVKGGVSQNGQLHVTGTQLCNKDGEPVVLHGMSTHGIQWFPQYASAESIKATADAGANLFRIAMYTAENGYISDKHIKNTVINAADAAISNDMYVIIDWHILSDGNPQTYKSEAKQFFTEMAERYADSPAVLYEICNEPNGNVSWKNDIKPYAEEMIQTIRAIDSDAIILVGSSTWSQDLDKAAESPISASNIMYTCHFYAGTHTQWLRDRITAAMKAGLPVFISEWGTSDASGNGGVYLDEAQKWIDFMNQNNISWANWSLCDKNESSAALISGASPSGGWSQAELTASGKFVFSKF